MKHLPNIITISRILLVLGSLPFAGSHVWLSFVAFYVWLSDHFDGILARKLNSTSSLGATLDHVSDKFASIFFLMLMTKQGLVPFWFAFVMLGRDVLSDMLKTMSIARNKTLPVSWMAKWKTGMLFLWCSGYFLAEACFGPARPLIVQSAIWGFQYLILLMSLYSLWNYFLQFRKQGVG